MAGTVAGAFPDEDPGQQIARETAQAGPSSQSRTRSSTNRASSHTTNPLAGNPNNGALPIPTNLAAYCDLSTLGNLPDFDLETSTAQQRASHLVYLMVGWEQRGVTGRMLHEVASDEFEEWTDEHFITCGKAPTDEFRRMLLTNGVFVRRNGGRVGQNIKQALSEPFHLWTDTEVEENANKYAHFRRLIRNDRDFLTEITHNRTMEDFRNEAGSDSRYANSTATANRPDRDRPIAQPVQELADPPNRRPSTQNQPTPPMPSNASMRQASDQSRQTGNQRMQPSQTYIPTDPRMSRPPSRQPNGYPYNQTDAEGRFDRFDRFDRRQPAMPTQMPNNHHSNHYGEQVDNRPVPPVPPVPLFNDYNDGMLPSIDNARKLTDLQKLYTEETKYSGDALDTLDTKILIFADRCRKVGITQREYASAFDVMLKGRAQEFYYDRLCNRGYGYTELVEHMRSHFETDQRRQLYLSEWRSITLRRVINADPSRSRAESLEWLVDRLVKLQRVLPPNYQSDETLRDQLINCCRDVPECNMSIFKPANTFEGVRNDLHIAIGMTSRPQEAYHQDMESDDDLDNDGYITDRTYRGNGRNNRYGQRQKMFKRPYQQHQRDGHDDRRNDRPRQQGHQQQQQDRVKKCYVCGKPGCWSTKHSPEERKAAYRRYKDSSYVSDHSTDAYHQFLTWHEGQADTYNDSIDDDKHDEEKDTYMQYQQTLDDKYGKPESNTFLMDHGPDIVSILAEQSTRHGLTKENPYNQSDDAGNSDDANPTADNADVDELFHSTRYNDVSFQGIMPDTGAANCSTGGHKQFKALQRIRPSLRMVPSTSVVRFGSGPSVKALGSTDVNTPLGEMTFHIIPTDTPFLLCLQDMDKMDIRYDNLANTLERGDVSVPIVRKWGHPWMLLNETPECFLTETELRRVHRRFGHPSVPRLKRVLERAGHDVDERLIAGIAKVCEHCQLHAGRPHRFKFKLHDDCEFNYEIVVDIMYLDGNRPVLHVVDSATSFNAARFLKDVTARCVWSTLRLCWIDVYQGPPDWMVTDAGTSFQAMEFHREARMMAISIKEVPIEAHHSIGKVERYHLPIRRAYEIIRSEDQSIAPESALQMAVKAVNDTAGPDGLIPTLLVFGAFPRITDDCAPSPSIVKRAEALRKATEEVRRCKARRMVNEALSTRNGPTTLETLGLPLQSNVRVWREVSKSWQGPFKLLAIEGEKCIVQMPQGPRSFRSTVVKPFYADEPDNSDQLDVRTDDEPSNLDQLDHQPNNIPPNCDQLDDRSADMPVSSDRLGAGEKDLNSRSGPTHETPPTPEVTLDTIVVDTSNHAPRRRRRNQPATFVCEIDEPDDDRNEDDDSDLPFVEYTHDVFLCARERHDLELAISLRKEGKIRTPGEPFELSSKAEIDGLSDRGVFEIVPFDQRKHGNLRIFNSRMVNEIKGKGTDKPYEKSRLVIQGYADDGKQTILTQAPTIQRASQRLILCIAPSLMRDYDQLLWLRDITQAYVQSSTGLNRVIVARLPTQIRHLHPTNSVMIIKKPLYGIAEAGTHWWGTYNRHHRENLQMEPSSYDPCLLVTDKDNKSFGIVGMQTDDTIGLSDEGFDKRENQELENAKFAAKPKQYLTIDSPIIFNGGIVNLDQDGNIRLKQKGQSKKLQLVNADDHDESQSRHKYVEQRARGAYIASICQPEACFDLSSAAQHQNPSAEQIKALDRRIKWQMENPDRGLTFIPLDLKTVKLFVFVDGSFANNQDLTSQLGFIVVLANEQSVEHDERDESFKLVGNVVHYSSTKCKRVTRSVLASEVYGMVAGVDIAYTISTTLRMVTDRLSIPPIPTVVCTDSYSLYECLVKLGTTKEKRLMIDIMALRQSYERRELTEIRWINGEDNLADCFTKSAPNRSLERFVDGNSTIVRKEGWVARS